MSYQSKHLVALFKVAPETLRQWTIEFKDYLSPTANPGANKQRFYSVSDVEILSLVNEQKKAGFTYEEIHVSLKNGERGTASQLQPEELEEIVGVDDDTQLAIQVSHLQHNLVLAQEALKRAEVQLQEMQTLKEDKIRLEVQLESAEKHHEAERIRLQTSVDQLNKQLQELMLQTGQQYAKGFKDGFQQHQQLSDDE